MSTPDGERFDARSPVGRYWLMHGLGFTVQTAEGRTLGVVDEVLFDSVRQRAQRVTVRGQGLGRLRRRTTLLPSLVETVVPESKLFIVRPASGEVRIRRRRRIRVREPAARVGVALAHVWAALARLAAGARPLAGWSRRQGAAALRLSARGAQRGARAGATASVAAATWARRDGPRLGAWLSARAQTSGRAAERSLSALGRAARAGSSHLAAQTRVASARLAAGARVAARALREVAVLAAVFVSDTWKKAAQGAPPAPPTRTPPAELPRLEAEPEPQSDLDAPLAREDGVRRPRTAARQASRKRGT
jgi:hypothetical protein